MKISNLYIKKNQLFIIFCLAVIVFMLQLLPFLSTFRAVLWDESWYANPGYNFSIGNGLINTNVGSGGNSNFLMAFLIGISFKLFGVSVFSARLVSVICGIVFLFFVFRIAKLYNLKPLSLAATFLIILSVSFYYSLFTYCRPESAAIAALTAAFYFLFKHLALNNNLQILWLSLAMYCAIIAHPFYAVFGLLIGCFLFVGLFKKWEFKKLLLLLLYGIICILAILSIAYADFKYNNFSDGSFLQSLLSLFSRTNSGMEIAEYGVVPDKAYNSILRNLRYWFLSPKILFSVILFIIPIGLFIKNYHIRLLAILALGGLLISYLIFSDDGDTSTYIWFPAFGISTLILLFLCDKFIMRKSFLFTLLAFCLINYAATMYDNISKRDSANLVLREKVEEIIPANASVLGDLSLWFFCYDTDFEANRYRKERTPIYDYVIFNTRDEGILFDLYKTLHIDLNVQYEMIYELPTKQYGKVTLFRYID